MYSKIVGLVFTGISGVCFALASLSVKMSGTIPLSLVILVRSVVQTSASLILNWVCWHENLLPRHKILPLLGFGVLSFLSIYGIYSSFQAIPLGAATVVISTCPVFVAVLERILLKTPVSCVTVVSGVMCSIGVLLLTHSGVRDIHGIQDGIQSVHGIQGQGIPDHTQGEQFQSGGVEGILETQELFRGNSRSILGYTVVTLATATTAATFIIVRLNNIHSCTICSYIL